MRLLLGESDHHPVHHRERRLLRAAVRHHRPRQRPPSPSPRSAAVPVTSFTLDGEEFVWTRRPNFSECNRPRFGVPVLFPSCGNPDNGVHIFDGKAYPMETHGFADLCAWEVDSVGPDGVTLALESTPLTKFLYPFDFTLLLNYNLEGNKALVSLTVINEGNTDMPFSFHPPPLLYRLQAGERGV